jgi:hypothetical protein
MLEKIPKIPHRPWVKCLGKRKTKEEDKHMNHHIFIGIGGMGVATLEAVKRNITHGEHRLHYLAIDTDVNHPSWNSEGQDSLKKEEKLALSIPESLAPTQDLEPSMLTWMDPSNQERGRHTRQNCRYALFLQGKELRRKLEEMVAAVVPGEKVTAHVFAGLSGGTGSGCFLDVCYLLREVLAQQDSTIQGYFFLPEVQLNLPGLKEVPVARKNLEAYTYTALQELAALMHLEERKETFDQSYPGFHICTQKPPVDTYTLIAGEDLKETVTSAARQSLGLPATADVPAYTLDTLNRYLRMEEMAAASQQHSGTGRYLYSGERSWRDTLPNLTSSTAE